MKRESRAAPTGSSHQREKKWPRRGKRRESVLKITSVLQSVWVSVCLKERMWGVGEETYLAPKLVPVSFLF